MIHSVLFAMTVAVCGQTEPAVTNDIQDKVDRLVRQLDARDRADRVSAEKQLIEMGASILPMLPRIDATTSSEKKNRLTRIRGELESAATVQSADASPLTLSGNMSLGTLFAAIKEQTGNEVIDFRNRAGAADQNRTLEVKFDKEPFWTAIDSIMDQAELTVYNFSGEFRKLALTARPPGERDRIGSACYSGPFRIEATEIFTQRNLRTPTMQGMRIRLEVLWEPRLTPLVIRHPYSNISIEADDGNEIAPTSPQGVAEVPVQSTVSGIDILVPVELPDREATQIDSLSGTFYALVPGKEVEFEFDKLQNARNIQQQQSGVRVTLDRVTKNRDIYEIRIRVKLPDTSERAESHLDWAANNVVQLIAADGKRIEDPNFERYFERDNEIGFRYLFPLEDAIENYKLRYRTPASLIEIPVEYELGEIDLP